MRRFVACSNCDRRYDASNTKVGARFRCHCGQVIEVASPRGHDASVVRCSSCGGAREQGHNRCGYCGADFTIHERDLNTVCPKCLTRVSDRAKYCRHCGTQMAGEPVMDGEESSLSCAVCDGDSKLANRRLGQEQVSVLECQMCAGLWLSTDSFMRLRDRVAKESTVDLALFKTRPRPAKLAEQTGPTYRKCIYCGKHMVRQQYARGSGVVIDICRDHGVWFDADELQQVLSWIARGGTQAKNAWVLRGERRQEPPQRQVSPPTPQRRRSPERFSEPAAEPDFLDVLVTGLMRLLR